MENERFILSANDDDQYAYDCHPVLTVTTGQTDSQTLCGREEICARFLCKHDVDLEEYDAHLTDHEQCDISSTSCSKNHWMPNDCGGNKLWVNDHVKGDGNCYFRSLSKAVTGVEQFHLMFRYVIVDHMRAHRDLYQCLIDGDIDAHMENMRDNKGGVFSWATEAEVKAAADVLGCDIYIQQQVGRKRCWCLYKSDEQFKRFEQYFLTIIYERHHFDLGRMVNHGCNCQLTRQDVINWEVDVVCETSDTNNILRYQYQLIFWNKQNRNLTCAWNKILENDEVITLFLTITLQLPSSMTSLPVYDIHILLYKGQVYVHDMVHAQTWGAVLLAGITISNESDDNVTQVHKDMCKTVHMSVPIEDSQNVICMYSVFLHLWHAVSRGRQIELFHALHESANIYKGKILAVHSEDLITI